MTPRLDAQLAEALAQLDDYGLLLLQDPDLPCVTRIVAGGPIRGSWLGNPQARGTYELLEALEEQDLLWTKLIAGKVTMVHRRLWPAVLAIARSGEPWQIACLTSDAAWLLRLVAAEGQAQTNDLPPPPSGSLKQIPEAARELERRLLVHATEVHTPTGAHAKLLQTWPTWSARAGFQPEPLSVPEAKHQLETAAGRLGPSARLPWAGGAQ